ncbi:MAG: hypothetical protein JXB30_12355 [Anaerolineae bacterium]|nr:hypothetical protein [Anaerolineae bacterium]
MPKRMPTWIRIAWRVGMMVIVCGMLSACNLGSPVPSDGFTLTPDYGIPQDSMGLPPTPTETMLFQVPPTATPEPELLPAEKLGPITIDGTTHRTQEPVTVRVQVGQSVSTVTCTYLLQDTNQTTALGTPTTQVISVDISEQVYTFTPQAAGTYQVNCTGIALTISGQRAVSAAGLPFAVEAKG